MQRSTKHLIPILAVILGAFLLAGCGGDDDGDSASSDATEAAGSGGAGDGSVSIVNFTFEPNSVTVSPGTTVTWTNEDSSAHTVTSDGDLEFDSGDMEEGATFEQTFDEPGTYSYFCDIHQYMTADVVVEG